MCGSSLRIVVVVVVCSCSAVNPTESGLALGRLPTGEEGVKVGTVLVLRLCRPEGEEEETPTRDFARSASVSESKNRLGVLKMGGE